MTKPSPWTSALERQAVDLVQHLMAIPGKSGEEGLVAQAVKQFLANMGVAADACRHDTAHRRSPMGGEIGNLFVHLPGNRRLPRIMLSAHLDTVPICVGCQPKRKGNSIVSANPHTGLGADDRAGVAAALMAVRVAWESLDAAHRPPIVLCFFVQEEVGLHGSRFMSVSQAKRPQIALNFDGGNPRKLTIGATGGERMKIQLHGIPAHAGLAPQDGASAITAAGLAIADLYKKKWLGAVRKSGRQGTSNIGVIHGGAATNVIAEQAELAAEARSHDSEFRATIADAIEQAFVDSAARVTNARGESVK
ncbi:MAG: M20/M25/M40 family metallo-hydrolase, partial [Planctomycetota bacterium]